MILRDFPNEVLLSSAYALFLLAVAGVLQVLAKHSHRRTDQYELAGFRYHSGFDHWECPEGNHLIRVESDPVRGTVRYRAPAHRCNECKRKEDCTDSASGREIEHHLDLWLQTGLRQFHRGLSLALIALAALLLVIEAARFPNRDCVTLLGVLFFPVACSGLKFLSSISAKQVAPTPRTRAGRKAPLKLNFATHQEACQPSHKPPQITRDLRH